MPRNAGAFRFDPSRTTVLRKRFIADINRRFNKLKADIVQLLVDDDAFGLIPNEQFVLNVRRQFEFRTDDAKVAAFRDWFEQRIKERILEVAEGTADVWAAEYVISAYRKGIVRSYVETHAASTLEKDFFRGSQSQFLTSAFAAPETVSKVKLLATRTLEDLKGVTQQMSANMNRILSDGIVHGRHPTRIAREMTQSVDISRKRAIVIARTETIHAHAEGQLDSLEKLGFDEVEMQVEFTTAGDKRVCQQCQGLAGRVYTIDNARGIIPVHPQCRCAWSPVIGKPASRK